MLVMGTRWWPVTGNKNIITMAFGTNKTTSYFNSTFEVYLIRQLDSILYICILGGYTSSYYLSRSLMK